MTPKHCYQAVLFDFDGTLFDSLPGLIQALTYTHQHYTQQKIKKTVDFKNLSRLNRKQLLSKILGYEASIEQEKFFVAYYKKILGKSLLAYKGLDSLLTYLNKQSISWGIVTNKPATYFPIIKQNTALLATAACLICPENVIHRKPHAEPLLKACQLLKITPKQALYVGDSIIDAQTAAACSMDFALACYGYTETSISDFHAINYKLHESPAELIPLLLKPSNIKMHHV